MTACLLNVVTFGEVATQPALARDSRPVWLHFWLQPQSAEQCHAAPCFKRLIATKTLKCMLTQRASNSMSAKYTKSMWARKDVKLVTLPQPTLGPERGFVTGTWPSKRVLIPCSVLGGKLRGCG